MARAPSENPYHHPFEKPLAFDFTVVENQCRECFEIVMATRAIGAFWNSDLEEFSEEPDWSFPLLIGQHQEAAEVRLSTILLSLSASYRALDDQICEERAYQIFKDAQKKQHQGFLVVYEGGAISDSLRECCNKIIHSKDFRPVYDNNSEPRDEGVYHMTGIIELQGSRGKTEWLVSLDIFAFLEAMLETVTFLMSEVTTDHFPAVEGQSNLSQ
ncbi:hypothetical protein [uncultured Pelagimonas sp.]|uniref:hypothetical protein n=1 Tax=uncultured Pelagimonas sp. TaxID=1618102 RepID=UPI002608D68E|nr:hypothetical protein [uncultured Pelagimonas sp.]